MFCFVSKAFLHGRYALTDAPTRRTLGLLKKQPYFLNLVLLSSSKFISTKANQDSEVVSFLINSYGLSPKSALSISKKVHIETPEKPELVLRFLKNHGFSQTQISKIMEKAPILLLRNPERTLLPKFEYFLSLGIPSSDIAAFVNTSPRILLLSLKKKIVPNFNALEELVKSKYKAIDITKRVPIIFRYDIEELVANLRRNGVPDAYIAYLIQSWPYLIASREEINQTIEAVKKMGFNPRRTNFIKAIVALRANSKAFWLTKVNIYKSWGLTEEQIFAAFAKCPAFIIASQSKISAMMDFFVNKMGWEASSFAERPNLVTYSLEKRILPRAAVVQYLSSKGLLEPKVSTVASLLMCQEKDFKKRCLTSLKDDPQLLKLYDEKLDLCKVKQEKV